MLILVTTLIDPKLVQLNIRAENWKDAIIKSGKPLVDNKLVTKNYLKGVIRIAEETGPYIVFMPHVALSHAKIEDGALKDGMGLTVLKDPVSFGNNDNDPVKYIFTLSSTKPDGHLSQMARLVDLLSSNDFFKNIDKAKNIQEIINYINKLEGEN